MSEKELINGTLSFTKDAEGKTISIKTQGDPIKLEDERVHIFNLGFINVQNGEPYPVRGTGLCDPDWRMFSDFRKDADINISDFQWLRAAADELEIPFTDTTGEIVTTIHSS